MSSGAEVGSRPACFGQHDDVIKVCTGSCSYVSECDEAADPYPAAHKSKEEKMNRDRLDEMRETEAKEKQEQERLLKANPLTFYSTTQLKAELRRRKKESGR